MAWLYRKAIYPDAKLNRWFIIANHSFRGGSFNLKVLIIDDEINVRYVIRYIGEWKKNGITTILEASNGEEAIKIIKKPKTGNYLYRCEDAENGWHRNN